MFNRLPESKPQRQRRLGGAIVSTGVHLVFIALAVRATGLKAEIAPKTEPVISIYVAPPEPAMKPDRAVSQPSPQQPDAIRVPAAIAVPDLPNLADIPTSIPDPCLTCAVTQWDARGLTSSVVSTGVTGPGQPNVADDSPLSERMVEKPILAIPGTSNPRYPSMLQSAGVEGDVRAQFVVDTLGRVESGSVKILETSHDLFGAAVRNALMRARFAPAEAGGRKVRQLAEQTFTFRITR